MELLEGDGSLSLHRYLLRGNSWVPHRRVLPTYHRVSLVGVSDWRLF